MKVCPAQNNVFPNPCRDHSDAAFNHHPLAVDAVAYSDPVKDKRISPRAAKGRVSALKCLADSGVGQAEAAFGMHA